MEPTEPAATEPVETEPATTEPGATEPADGGTETTLDVELTEFVVDLALDTVNAGTVTFNVTNNGTIPHNFKVIKTDLAEDALPVIEDEFIVDEEQVDVVASSADLEVGQAEELTVELEAGSYVLICNIATHYEAGTRTAFTVE
ncbi:MAG: hypothetical protein A2148_06950 [Chloroflexi bacterium RBG_16_68_14]|nr:MAG: hypothetical protein A2148_06950 [Chloroflexi bacterium RBG_16_68_14]